MFGFKQVRMALDIGTTHTRIINNINDDILCEPSIVAMDKKTHEVIAIGNEAKNMVGRTPESIVAVRPIKGGVISDYDTTTTMLKHYIQQVKGKGIFSRKPEIIVCVPSGITSVEKRAVVDATRQAGAKEALIMEEPYAAALGAGLHVKEPEGHIAVSIGGGSVEAAVISCGDIVVSSSSRVAGDDMDEAIISYIRQKYSLLIGEPTAESIKIEIGSANSKGLDFPPAVVRGRDLVTGLPKTIEVTKEEISEALAETVQAIVTSIKNTLENTPPELSSDIMAKGIVLTGGAAQLHNLDEAISNETKMPVIIAENPVFAVVKGAAKSFEDMSYYKKKKNGLVK